MFCKGVSSSSPVHCSRNLCEILFFFFYCLLTNIGYYNGKDSELICNVYVIFYGSLICISLIAMRLNHLKIGIPFSANWVSSFEEHSFPQCTAHGQTYTQDLEINTLLVVFQAIVYSSSSLLILIVLLSGLLCVLHRCSLHLWFLQLLQSLESNNAIKEVIITQFYFF